MTSVLTEKIKKRPLQKFLMKNKPFKKTVGLGDGTIATLGHKNLSLTPQPNGLINHPYI